MKRTGTEMFAPFADLRARAESKLSGPHRPYLTPVPEDLGQLIRELQLHRAELELQNEELRETEVQLLDASQRYRELYDAAPVAYVTLDRRGKILEANRAASELLGTERTALIGTALSRFMAQADADRFHLHRWEVLSGAKGAALGSSCGIPTPGGRRVDRVGGRDHGLGTECRSALIDVSSTSVWNGRQKARARAHACSRP
jgi:PAS domain-containing protein